MEIADSVIIITGSAVGIGAATAKAAAAKGARVLINYTKSETQARQTAQACRDLGGEAITCGGNIANDHDCRQIAQAALNQWGRIDGLVNNAGASVFASANDLESLSADDFLNIYSINVVGAYQMTRAAAPHLKASGHGAIVNVSSISAITGGGSSIAYAASKAALNAMTLALARALAPEIRINAVCPGPIPTRWWTDGLGQDAANNLFQSFRTQAPLQAAPTPESVADTITWLLESAAHITGETIMIDSGIHLATFKP